MIDDILQVARLLASLSPGRVAAASVAVDG